MRLAAGRCSSPFTRSARPSASAIASCFSAAAAYAAKVRSRSWRPRRASRHAISKRCSLRSHRPPFLWLLEKEWRELLVSRAWWVLLIAMGPLVGLSFISAVRTYGEVSGLNGTAAGVGEALSPLIGVWAPTFSACELAAVFLLPFVAIRLAGGDRQSGALKLELQKGMPSPLMIAAKTIVGLGGWL